LTRSAVDDPKGGDASLPALREPSVGPGARSAPATLAVALVVAFGALAAWLGWRSLGWPLVHDAPIMHYVAWRISQGAVPYRDVFDMNFPGVYLVHLAVLRGLGPGDVAWRVFDLGWLAASAGAIAVFARPWGPVATAGGALFFAAHHLAGGAWQAGQRDFLLCPFLLVGALGVVRWLESSGDGRRVAAAAHRSASAAGMRSLTVVDLPRAILPLALGGLALGAGVTIKPHAIVPLAVLAAVVAIAASRRGVSAAPPVGALVGGALLPPLAVVAWLASVGALGAWMTIVVEYLVPLYSRLGRPAQWGFHRWTVWIPLLAAVALSLAYAGRRGRFGARHLVATLGVVCGVAHYVGQGKGWEYHVYPLAAFTAVLLFSELQPALAERRVVGLAVAVVLCASWAMLAAKGAEAADATWIRDKARRVDAVVRDLTAAPACARVQSLDTTEGGVHALLRLRIVQPTRFLYDFHFFHDTAAPLLQRLRAEFARDMAARPPDCIVLFRRGWPVGGYERVAGFPELARTLTVDYRVRSRGDGYIVYAKPADS
jgi:hypothetical protein